MTQSGPILRGFRHPAPGGSKSQKSRLRPIASCGRFVLWGTYSSMYSQGNCIFSYNSVDVRCVNRHGRVPPPFSLSNLVCSFL